uniref:NADH dehydrogenase subunit 3 n=1 Tax=Exoristobia philippinensis TaxID=3081681 RepID=UPI002A805002|nr:NADH dehydrogenase subunit 3 [Exoristobia philippinensis]WOE90348.1 NADH dehydrogenase subunit 3 [Exoristobia philippinensis]
MNMLLFSFMFVFILVNILLLMNFFLSKKNFKDREKMSSFECGFDPLTKNRLPFSLQFYLVTIIFLIFDIEIAIILPFSLINYTYYFNLMNFLMLILLLLLLGLYLEWWEGALKWFK